MSSFKTAQGHAFRKLFYAAGGLTASMRRICAVLGTRNPSCIAAALMQIKSMQRALLQEIVKEIRVEEKKMGLTNHAVRKTSIQRLFDARIDPIIVLFYIFYYCRPARVESESEDSYASPKKRKAPVPPKFPSPFVAVGPNARFIVLPHWDNMS